MHSSHENAQCTVILQSSGSIETHRLLAMCIRYCIKRGRLYMENLGYQNVNISQAAPILISPEDNIFDTKFTLQGVILDSWIHTISSNLYEPIYLTLTAYSENEDNESVEV